MNENPKTPRPEDVLIEALVQASSRKDKPVYEFAGFRLEIDEHRLLRNGTPVPLPPKEFETLRLLVEQHGRLVSKQMLLDQVWAGTFVREDTIAQRISILRKALGEDTASAKYIETVPKRGYRFVAPIRVL